MSWQKLHFTNKLPSDRARLVSDPLSFFNWLSEIPAGISSAKKFHFIYLNNHWFLDEVIGELQNCFFYIDRIFVYDRECPQKGRRQIINANSLRRNLLPLETMQVPFHQFCMVVSLACSHSSLLFQL